MKIYEFQIKNGFQQKSGRSVTSSMYPAGYLWCVWYVWHECMIKVYDMIMYCQYVYNGDFMLEVHSLIILSNHIVIHHFISSKLRNHPNVC